MFFNNRAKAHAVTEEELFRCYLAHYPPLKGHWVVRIMGAVGNVVSFQLYHTEDPESPLKLRGTDVLDAVLHLAKDPFMVVHDSEDNQISEDTDVDYLYEMLDDVLMHPERYRKRSKRRTLRQWFLSMA